MISNHNPEQIDPDAQMSQHPPPSPPALQDILSPDGFYVLRRAAEATDHTLTEFILGSAVEHAERVMADRRWFIATEDQFEEFKRLLDAPLPSTTKFEKLFARPSVFSDKA